MGQTAAVGVAEDESFCTAAYCRFEALQGIFTVVLEAVEKVFGIVEELVNLWLQPGKTAFNDLKILWK